MQALDRVQRRQDGALLPGRNVGGVLAGQNDSPIDLTEVVVMRFSRFIRPVARAAKRERDTVQATETPFSNSVRYCGWIWAPNSTARFTLSAGGIAVNS